MFKYSGNSFKGYSLHIYVPTYTYTNLHLHIPTQTPYCVAEKVRDAVVVVAVVSFLLFTRRVLASSCNYFVWCLFLDLPCCLNTMRTTKRRTRPGRKPRVQHKRVSEFLPSKCIIAEKSEADSTTIPEPITVPCVAEIDNPPNMVLISSDQVRFHCHQAILARASNVFAEIVANNHETIQLISIGSDAIRAFLHYIYTGAWDQLTERPSRLLPAAQFYGMVRLKVLIERILCTQIQHNNAVNLMLLSDRFSAEFLKRRTMEFICVHYHLISASHLFKIAALTNVQLFRRLHALRMSF